MSKEIIKSIEINIGDTTVKVDQKQLRALFDALKELFGEPKTVYSYPYSYPYRWACLHNDVPLTGPVTLFNQTTTNLDAPSTGTVAGKDHPISLTIQ